MERNIRPTSDEDIVVLFYQKTKRKSTGLTRPPPPPATQSSQPAIKRDPAEPESSPDLEILINRISFHHHVYTQAGFSRSLKFLWPSAPSPRHPAILCLSVNSIQGFQFSNQSERHQSGPTSSSTLIPSEDPIPSFLPTSIRPNQLMEIIAVKKFQHTFEAQHQPKRSRNSHPSEKLVEYQLRIIYNDLKENKKSAGKSNKAIPSDEEIIVISSDDEEPMRKRESSPIVDDGDDNKEELRQTIKSEYGSFTGTSSSPLQNQRNRLSFEISCNLTLPRSSAQGSVRTDNEVEKSFKNLDQFILHFSRDQTRFLKNSPIHQPTSHDHLSPHTAAATSQRSSEDVDQRVKQEVLEISDHYSEPDPMSPQHENTQSGVNEDPDHAPVEDHTLGAPSFDSIVKIIDTHGDGQELEGQTSKNNDSQEHQPTPRECDNTTPRTSPMPANHLPSHLNDRAEEIASTSDECGAPITHPIPPHSMDKSDDEQSSYGSLFGDREYTQERISSIEGPEAHSRADQSEPETEEDDPMVDFVNFLSHIESTTPPLEDDPPPMRILQRSKPDEHPTATVDPAELESALIEQNARLDFFNNSGAFQSHPIGLENLLPGDEMMIEDVDENPPAPDQIMGIGRPDPSDFNMAFPDHSHLLDGTLGPSNQASRECTSAHPDTLASEAMDIPVEPEPSEGAGNPTELNRGSGPSAGAANPMDIPVGPGEDTYPERMAANPMEDLEYQTHQTTLLEHLSEVDSDPEDENYVPRVPKGQHLTKYASDGDESSDTTDGSIYKSEDESDSDSSATLDGNKKDNQKSTEGDHLRPPVPSPSTLGNPECGENDLRSKVYFLEDYRRKKDAEHEKLKKKYKILKSSIKKDPNHGTLEEKRLRMKLRKKNHSINVLKTRISKKNDKIGEFEVNYRIEIARLKEEIDQLPLVHRSPPASHPPNDGEKAQAQKIIRLLLLVIKDYKAHVTELESTISTLESQVKTLEAAIITS